MIMDTYAGQSQFLLSITNFAADIHWSKWVELMRKDMEYFGKLKGHWHTLKTEISLDGVRIIDNVWITCCALHNWLLDIDGMLGKWISGVPQRTGEMSLHKDDFSLDDSTVPQVIKSLLCNLNFRNYDTSRVGPGDDLLDID